MIIKTNKILITLLLLIGQTLSSQTGGENIFSFLNVASNAKQIALGGKTISLTNDVNQAVFNPATINNNLNNQLAVNYTSYLAGTHIGSVSFAHKINNHIGTLHSSINYFNYGTLIRADVEGNELGTFNASDIAVSLGYAYQIPNTYFRIGSNLKFIHSAIDNFSSTGLALDLGILYKNPLKPYTLALSVRNIGTQLSTYNGTEESLPFEVILGGDYQLEKVPLRWYFTMDNLQKWQVAVANPSNSTTDLEGNTTDENIGFVDNLFRHFVIGAELFPESVINLRVGYNFRRNKELRIQNTRSFGGLSFGFGLKMNRIKLNYALARYHSASNVSTFSLNIDLDRDFVSKKAKSY